MVPKPDVLKSNHRPSTDAEPELEVSPLPVSGQGEEADEDDGSFLEPDGEIEPAVRMSDDDELLILSPLSDEFDEKVAEAQEQLLHLRHQQEQLEKQKAQLEELKRKREKFLRGRAEATERLTKAKTMLEREIFEAKKRLEQFGRARDVLSRHLAVLDAINPEAWTRDEMPAGLSHALAAIQDAREDYTAEMARVSALVDVMTEAHLSAPLPIEVAAEPREPEGTGAGLPAMARPAEAVSTEVRDFIYWLKSGFAFTLPLLIFGIFALFLLLVIF